MTTPRPLFETLLILGMISIALILSVRFYLQHRQSDKSDQVQLNTFYLPFLGGLKLISAIGSTSILVDLYITGSEQKFYILLTVVIIQLTTSTVFLCSNKSTCTLILGLIISFTVALLGCFFFSNQFQPLSLPLLLITATLDWLLTVVCLMLLNKTARLAQMKRLEDHETQYYFLEALAETDPDRRRSVKEIVSIPDNIH